MLLWTVHLTPYTLSLLPLLSLLATSQPSFTLSAGTVDSSKPLWVPPPGRLDALPLGFKTQIYIFIKLPSIHSTNIYFTERLLCARHCSI